MTAARLVEIVASHGLAITDWHGGAGKFRDIYIGVGAEWDSLHRLRESLRKENVVVKISFCNNPEHPDYNKPMVELPSFWWEDPAA